jgi:hypothetical protein
MRTSGTDHDDDNSLTVLLLKMISLVLLITQLDTKLSPLGLKSIRSQHKFLNLPLLTPNNILFDRAFEGYKVRCLTNRFECFDRINSSINLRSIC